MDNQIEKLFDNETEIKFEYRGATVIYTYRHPDSREWLEYQRRAAHFTVRNKEVRATEESTGARLWLHDKIRRRVEAIVHNPEGNEETRRVEVEDRFPPMVKDQAILGYLNQINTSDDQGN